MRHTSSTRMGWLHPAEAELVDAVAQQNLTLVKRALGRGASPDAPDAEGRPVLHVALALGDASVAQTLLAAGANPLHADALGRTGHRAIADSGLGMFLEPRSR